MPLWMKANCSLSSWPPFSPKLGPPVTRNLQPSPPMLAHGSDAAGGGAGAGAGGCTGLGAGFAATGRRVAVGGTAVGSGVGGSGVAVGARVGASVGVGSGVAVGGTSVPSRWAGPA